MNRIGTYIKSVTKTTRTVFLGLAVIFVSAGIAQAATTISTNITTAGTLSVTDQTTLGQATSTRFSAYSAYFGGSATSTFSTAGALTLVAALSGTSATFSTTLGVTGVSTFSNSSTTQSATIGGPLWIGGNATTTAAGAISTQSTLTVGTIASTSQLIVGGDATNGTLSGLVQGTCQLTATALKTASTTLTCGATGVRVGDKAFLTPPSNLESWIRFVGATTTTADQIAVSVLNASTTADVTGGLRPWQWMAIR